MESKPVPPKSARPSGVTVVGIVAIAGGVLSLFGGFSVLSGTAAGPVPLAVVVVLFGILGLLLGATLLTSQSWARMATIIVYLLSIPLGIAEILYGGMVGGFGGIIRIMAGVVIPTYLMRPKPKAYFT